MSRKQLMRLCKSSNIATLDTDPKILRAIVLENAVADAAQTREAEVGFCVGSTAAIATELDNAVVPPELVAAVVASTSDADMSGGETQTHARADDTVSPTGGIVPAAGDLPSASIETEVRAVAAKSDDDMSGWETQAHARTDAPVSPSGGTLPAAGDSSSSSSETEARADAAKSDDDMSGGETQTYARTDAPVSPTGCILPAAGSPTGGILPEACDSSGISSVSSEVDDNSHPLHGVEVPVANFFQTCTVSCPV